MSVEKLIQDMAGQFATGVLEALRGQSLGALLGDDEGPSAPRTRKASAPRHKAPAKVKSSKGAKAAKPKIASGRLARRSPEEIDAVVVDIVKLLRRSPEGLRAEDIRKELGLAAKEMPRVMKQGVADKAFKILSGQKRSTTYGLKGGAGKAPKPARKAKAKPAGRKVAPKAAPKKAARAKPKKKAAAKSKKVGAKKAKAASPAVLNGAAAQ